MANPQIVERTACPACHAKSFTSIYALPEGSAIIRNYLDEFYRAQGGVDHELLTGWKFELLQCADCNLVFQKFILGHHLMEVLYEKWINPAVTFEMSRQHPLLYYLNLVEEVKQLVAWFNKRPDHLRVLDFGMGWAEWCKVAAALGCQAYGAELSPARQANARAHNIQVIDINACAPDFFDAINTEQVFEHIPDPLVSLRHLATLVRPGGLIKISVPDSYKLKKLLKLNDWNAPKGTENSLNVVAPLEHINSFTHRSLATMASLAGLQPVPALTFQNYPQSVMAGIKNKFRAHYIKWLRPNKGTYLYFQKHAA
ncbi:MAG: class I SAM-dependent methyltransferase [Cytophagales bacterium]|nr:class I SAM-dependent methyltransferase [Cytophagales bacterium]